MAPTISLLTQVRKQLVKQQSSINECLTVIDSLIISQIGTHEGQDNETTRFSTDYNSTIKKFPKDISTKRAKLKYILSKSIKPLTAKEIKNELFSYGEDLPNVDQSLVNLEKVKQISSKIENDRKKYF